MSFKNRNMVIFGATGGIGSALARQLALDSGRLTLAARNPDRLSALSDELQAHAVPVEATNSDAFLTRLGDSPRAPKMRAVFEVYAAGASLDEVMAETGASRGTVSNYLNELERETGASIVRSQRRAAKTDALQKHRENGQRRASLHDFHSFRVTWITLALAAGVPLELVQRVTGHRTVDVVLKHYFRQVLFKAMPKMLGVGSPGSAKDEMRRVVEGMTERTWKRDRERLRSLLKQV